MMDKKPEHYIYVGPQGTLAPSTSGPVSTPDSIDAVFAQMVQENSKQMVIYFHGGMVPRESGEKTAGDLDPMFRDIGGQPVFFIWETDVLTTIRQNLLKLMSSEIVKSLLKYILSQVVKRWVGANVLGKGSGETMTLEEIEVELTRERPFDELAQASDRLGGAKGGPEPVTEESLAQAQAEMELELAILMGQHSDELEAALIAAADNELLSETIREEAADTDARGVDLLVLVGLAVKVGVRVLKRYKNWLDHGPYPTTVEELLREVGLDGVGKFLWDSMKDKAEAMWQPNPAPLPASPKDIRAGAYFLDRLMAYAKDHPDLKVDLVGHSAGSIVICHLLEAAATRYPGFRFGRIALLAPAARMDLFTKTIVSHPERFEKLRMYTMKNELEERDAIAGPVYPLSLVFFVSGTMEDPGAAPLCGLARCLTGTGPYATGDSFKAHQYMHAPGEERLVLSITDESAAPGLRCNARHHGDFNNLKIKDEETGDEEKVPGETIPSLQVFFSRTP